MEPLTKEDIENLESWIEIADLEGYDAIKNSRHIIEKLKMIVKENDKTTENIKPNE